jgi:hypothetical protein
MPEYHHYASNLDSSESTRGYRVIDGARAPIAKETLDAYAELVSVWHKALTLHHDTIYGVFTGVPAMEYLGDPGDEAGVLAWNLRHSLLGGTARTSKLGLDAALAAYYTESAALSRHITESWAQAAFLRFRPDESRRWSRTQDGQRPHAPKFQTLISQLRRAGLSLEMLKLANSLFDAASDGAHPSPAFMRRVGLRIDETGAHLSYVPHFSADYCHSVLEWGTMATILVVWELGNTELQPTEWHVEFQSIEDLFKRYRGLYNGKPEFETS